MVDFYSREFKSPWYPLRCPWRATQVAVLLAHHAIKDTPPPNFRKHLTRRIGILIKSCSARGRSFQLFIYANDRVLLGWEEVQTSYFDWQ